MGGRGNCAEDVVGSSYDAWEKKKYEVEYVQYSEVSSKSMTTGFRNRPTNLRCSIFDHSHKLSFFFLRQVYRTCEIQKLDDGLQIVHRTADLYEESLKMKFKYTTLDLMDWDWFRDPHLPDSLEATTPSRPFSSLNRQVLVIGKSRCS